jgi:hypothetical protein
VEGNREGLRVKKEEALRKPRSQEKIRAGRDLSFHGFLAS